MTNSGMNQWIVCQSPLSLPSVSPTTIEVEAKHDKAFMRTRTRTHYSASATLQRESHASVEPKDTKRDNEETKSSNSSLEPNEIFFFFACNYRFNISSTIATLNYVHPIDLHQMQLSYFYGSWPLDELGLLCDYIVIDKNCILYDARLLSVL